jgi:hypothetical protein
MIVLRAIRVVAGGVAGGLAAADRAVAAATERGRGSGEAEAPEPEAAQSLRDSFPSQCSAASMLDPYVELADERAYPSSR